MRRLLRLLAPAVLAAGLLSPGQAKAQRAYDYCREFPDAATTLILLDRTSQLDQTDMARLEAGWTELVKGIREGGRRIVVRTIADYWNTSQVLFEDCLPECPPGSAEATWNRCRRNGMLADRNRFGAGLRSAILETYPRIANSQKPESGIVETIGNAAPLHFGPRPEGKGHELIIFSDLIEYRPRGRSDPGISFYHDDDATLGRYLDKVERDHLIPDLGGVKVIAFGFRKALGPRVSIGTDGQPVVKDMTERQWSLLYRFWMNYFAKAKVSSGLSLELEFAGLQPKVSTPAPVPVAQVPPMVAAPPAEGPPAKKPRPAAKAPRAGGASVSSTNGGPGQ